MPIVNADAARWSNATMPANAREQQISQGAKIHSTVEGKNVAAFEARATQEQGSH